ncbi:MAG: hypothetical protein ACRDPD_28835 [Streptosporangiaceae bacterium]
MSSKKQRSGKSKGPRQGISGNPQRRAEQIAQRRAAGADGADSSPLVMDFRSQQSPFQELARALAGGANPAPWWGESHERIIAAARALTWPADLIDLETQACRIVGDEFYERLNSAVTGLQPSQWLRALAEETAAALRADIGADAGSWQQLWALLYGLALTVPPGDAESETGRLARERFPDIKDPYETTIAEAGLAAKLLADRGLAVGIDNPADGCRPAGEPLVARDAYGSRFLLVAPFSYGQDRDQQQPDHWYAWDIDWCWIDVVVSAGVFGSAEEALREWRDAVGDVASGATLSPSPPGTTARLLAPCLQTGSLSDLLQGSEPRELIREYYRLRRRARDLVGAIGAPDAHADAAPFDTDPVLEAFLGWYAAQSDDAPAVAPEDAGTILQEWGPREPLDERLFYACSPHRIEMTARLIRDSYRADYANAALPLLPQWTEWCIERGELTGDLAARSRGAALTEAAALADEETGERDAERDDAPFRRQE